MLGNTNDVVALETYLYNANTFERERVFTGLTADR